MIGVVVLALLPVAAAVSLQAATPTTVPLAITQPVTMPFGPSWQRAVLSESGRLMLVGSALFGLAGIVRRTT